MRCSTVMVTAAAGRDVDDRVGQACLMRGRNCMKTSGSGDGRPSLGWRAWPMQDRGAGLGGDRSPWVASLTGRE